MSGPAQVAPGVVVIYSDIACPWAHLAVHRLRLARRQLGLQWREAQDWGVQGSPHLFVQGGGSFFNPGVQSARLPVEHEHFVRVERDDPSVYGGIVISAAGQP